MPPSSRAAAAPSCNATHDDNNPPSPMTRFDLLVTFLDFTFLNSGSFSRPPLDPNTNNHRSPAGRGARRGP